MINFYIYLYIYIYTHTHTYIHTYIYIYIYLLINIKNSGKPETVYWYWPVFEIYRTVGQTGTASGMVLTPLIHRQNNLKAKWKKLKANKFSKWSL